ncbi:TonB-dependent receptor plug domain-containing protein [bacterium]|nr:TonB-dependent receptor plug domain-containing protein [bacterium]
MFKKLVLFILFPLLLPAVLFAQQTVGIQVVQQKSGIPLGAVPVVLQNKTTGYQQTRVSDSSGWCIFQIATAGTYLAYSAPSALIATRDTAVLEVNSVESKSATLSVWQKINALPEVAAVADKYSVATINANNASVGSELSATEIQLLPVEGRDMTRALYRLPNVSQATGFYPEAPNVAINGANSLFTNYLIDGFDNNENFLGGMRFNNPQGFTRSIDVLTNNYSTEFGLTANGIVNLSTKMGGNKTQGEVYYLTRPGAVVDAQSPYAQRDLSGNEVKSGFSRQQFGFGIGGAIKANKTYYYINSEQTFDTKDNHLYVPELGINIAVRGHNKFNYSSIRLDQFWNNKWHSSLRANMGKISIDRQGGGLDGGVTFSSAASTQLRNSFALATKNEYFGKWFSWQSNYQFAGFNWNYARPSNNKQPDVTVWGSQEQTIAFLGNPGFVFNEFERTHQLQEKISITSRKHLIKAGLELKSSGFRLYGGGNPNGSYLVKLDSHQLQNLRASQPEASLSIYDIPQDVQVLNYSVELRPAAFAKRQNIYSAYIEDEWKPISKLSLNFGLRYDYDNLSKGGSSKGDYNNVAPRFSFNYKLNTKSALRGGAGIFYEKILYSVYSDAMQFSSTGDGFRRQLQILIDEGILPKTTNIDQVLSEGNLKAVSQANYLQGPTAQNSDLQAQRNTVFSNEMRILNPNGYQNPYSVQLMLGYQLQLGKKWLFYVDAVHNHSYNLFRLRNLNAPSPYTVNPENVQVRSVAEADATRPIPIENGQYALDNGQPLYGVARNIIMTETAGESIYKALSLTLNKSRADDKYSLRLSYTLSKLSNNTEDINFRAMDANNFKEEWGPALNDRRHNLNAFVTLFPKNNLSLTVAWLLQSGQPINRIPDAGLFGTTDLNGDGRSFGDAYVGNSDRWPGASRNSDRLPWNNTLDLSLQYRIKSRNGHHLELKADVFNLLNSVNLSGFANNATRSNQIQIGPVGSSIVIKNAAPPRQFQFGLRYLI